MKKMIAFLMILTVGLLAFAPTVEANNLAPPIGVELSVDNSFEQATPVEYISVAYVTHSVVATVPGYRFDQYLYAEKPGSYNKLNRQEREAIGLNPDSRDFI
jgi:hypothetical protein